MEENKTKIILCDCNSTEHQIVFSKAHDEDLVYCHIHLAQRSFWRRLISGITYIFGRRCSFGHWEEFILNKESSKEIYDLFDE